MQLTEKEIEDYINWTMTSGEFHIRQELEWLIECADEDTKETIREISKQWNEE